MQKRIKHFSQLLLIFLLLNGCQKEEAPDVRDSLVGTYQGVIKLFEEDVDESLIYLGSQNDYAQNIRCEKDLQEGQIVFFKEDNSLVFKGDGVTKGDNGIVFNILEKTISSGTTYYPYNAVKLGVDRFSGVYDFSSRKILFYQYWIEQGTKFVYVYEGVK